MNVKEESEKAGLKLNIQKTKTMPSGPITSWQMDGETMERVRDFILGAPKSLWSRIKRHFFPGRKSMINLDSILKNRETKILCQQRSE